MRQRGIWLGSVAGVLAALLFGIIQMQAAPVPLPVQALVIGAGPMPVRAAPEAEMVSEALVPYAGPVEHIFFHPLIVYPELAFDGDFLARGYDDWFVTVKEFKRIIEALHQNGYILVGFDTLLDEAGARRRPLMLPPGKKPLVLSIDDLNYYDYMRQNGNAFKLVIDTDGALKTYSRSPQGADVVSADNEIVPILDDYVAHHRDFSFHGAKGVIALTGYEGILGYRTNNRTAPGYEQERQDALRVVQRLKETGWSFASHGWGHLDAAKISLETLTRDTRRWKEEVEPLTGPTPVYIYPFGSGVAPGDAKFRYLQSEGFRIFCGVGPDPFLDVKPGYVRMDRRHIDGMAFRTQRQRLLPLFDANAVVDDVRRM